MNFKDFYILFKEENIKTEKACLMVDGVVNAHRASVVMTQSGEHISS